MTNYLLSQWEAVELFCKIISKYENISISEFNNNERLLYSLIKCDAKYSKKFSEECLQQLVADEGKESSYPSGLYDLSQAIQFEQPVMRSANRLLLLLKYIGEHLTISRFRSLVAWKPNDKQRMFEGNIWALYYYEEYVELSNGTPHPGITRAIIKFDNFTKISIDNIDASKGIPGEKEKYKGRYSIYGGDAKHLFIEGRLGDAKERDLHILLFIGTGEYQTQGIALGQYHNISTTIYSGTAIIEKLPPDSQLEPQFFERDDERIEPVFWEYFRNKEKNRIRTKEGLTKKSELQAWIDLKKGGRGEP